MAGVDVRMIDPVDGPVEFIVRGKSSDTGLMLLQRLYVMLFTDQDNIYRGNESIGYSLLGFTEGANQPPDQVLNSLLAISCANAVRMLEEKDRELIDSFSGWSVDGAVTFTLVLTDGTTVQGAI